MPEHQDQQTPPAAGQKNGAHSKSVEPKEQPAAAIANTPTRVLADAVQSAGEARHIVVIMTMGDGAMRTLWSDADIRFTLGALDLAHAQVIERAKPRSPQVEE